MLEKIERDPFGSEDRAGPPAHLEDSHSAGYGGAVLLHDLGTQSGINPAEDLGRDFRPGDDRALLGDPVAALGEHVELIVLGQQLHLHAGASGAPRFVQQRLLQAREPSFRCAHQVLHRRIARAHRA